MRASCYWLLTADEVVRRDFRVPGDAQVSRVDRNWYTRTRQQRGHRRRGRFGVTYGCSRSGDSRACGRGDTVDASSTSCRSTSGASPVRSWGATSGTSLACSWGNTSNANMRCHRAHQRRQMHQPTLDVLILLLCPVQVRSRLYMRKRGQVLLQCLVVAQQPLANVLRSGCSHNATAV